MSHQTTLQEFYKCKSSPSPSAMNNTGKKRRSLSLIKPLTPKKCPKIQSSHVINLVSDDESLTEDQDVSSSQNSVQSSTSISTEDKIKTPSTPRKSPGVSSSNHSSPKNAKDQDVSSSQNSVQSSTSISTEDKIKTPSTPRKSPGVTSSNHSSPKNAKFFSPVKKRAVFKTPTKRNLALELNGSSPTKQMPLDEDFVKACEGMDDKSVFLLTIINKFLNNDNLRHLLDESSLTLLSQCLHLIKPGIRLVCRLYWRQHNWFKEEQLVNICSDKNEQNNENFQSMLHCLIENGLIVSSAAAEGDMSFDEMAKTLKSEELKQICKDLKMKIQKKEDAVDALRKFMKQSSISKYFMGNSNESDNTKRVMQIMRSKLGTCYKLSELASITLYKLYLLMYLGMNYSIIRDKKLEITIINSKIRTETYPAEGIEADDASVVFTSRDDFIKYLKAQITYENYLSEPETCGKCQIVRDTYRRYQNIDEEDMNRYKSLPIWLRRFTPAYKYVKILETGVQELKKEKCPESLQLCVDILTILISQSSFRQHKKAEWFAEKGLILHKLLARHDEAAEVLIEGLKSDLSEEDKDVIRPRALKIANQQNITVREDLQQELIDLSHDDLILESSFPAEHINKHHMENPGVQRGKKKFVVDTWKGRLYLDAEDYCAHHYKNNGKYTDAEHWEGRIITTMFFLLFWEIIYTKPRGVPGIFLSHYQIYPLDMFCEGFYKNRKKLIDDRLIDIQNMETDELVDAMQQTLAARSEQELSGIHRGTEQASVQAAACLGARRVAALCARLARDCRRWSGFPDLTVWNTNTGEIKFIEVKTDTDKPSRKQLQWMKYLKDNDIETGFCYVGAFTTKCKARALGNIKEATEFDDETPRTPSKTAEPKTPKKSPQTPKVKTPKKSRTPNKARTTLSMTRKSTSPGGVEAPKTPNKMTSPRNPIEAPGSPENDKVFVPPKKSKARPKINIRSVADINKITDIS